MIKYRKLLLIIVSSLLLTSCVIHLKHGFEICFNKRCVYGKLYDKYLKFKINMNARIYVASKKLKRKRSDKNGSVKGNQKSKSDSNYANNKPVNSGSKREKIDSKSKPVTVTISKPDTLKRGITNPDTVSIQVNSSSKDSVKQKCQQNLIIHYPFDVAQLSDSDKVIISKEIGKNQVAKIIITGYTDSIGGDGKYNKQLSFKRAKIISMYLLDLGVGKSKILYNGLSSTSPLADNGTEQGRWLNRRTEILIEYICN